MIYTYLGNLDNLVKLLSVIANLVDSIQMQKIFLDFANLLCVNRTIFLVI